MGQLYQFHVWPKFTSKLSGEFYAFQHFDPGDDQGKTKTELKLAHDVNADQNGKLEFGVWGLRDADALDAAHHATRNDGIWTQYSYNQSDKIWWQYFTDLTQSKINFIDANGANNETTGSNIEVQSRIDLTSILNVSLLGKLSNEWPKLGNRSKTKLYKLNLSNNFTKNFTGKAGYWWKQTDNEKSSHHPFVKLSYVPDNVTSLNLEYSSEGDFNGIGAEVKRLKFSASTKF